MKSVLFSVMILLFGGTAFGQEQFTDIGAFTDEELALTKAAFDPDASAILLRKDAMVVPDEDGRMIMRHRMRLKILRTAGVEKGNVKIRFQHFNQAEKCTDINAVVYNLDETGKRTLAYLNEKDVYTRKIDDYFSHVTFSLPDVRVGSIIEYTYTLVRRSYRTMERWYFQDDVPVLKSVFDFTILPNAQFSYRVVKSPNLRASVSKDDKSGKVVFSMGQVPALREEPHMDAINDYLQRVELQLAFAGSGLDREKYVSTWPEANNSLLRDESFGLFLDRSVPGTGALIERAKATPDLHQRMLLVYQEAYQRLRWDGYWGIYASVKPKQAWDNSRGNVADLNLLLVSLMRAAGLEADPLLVSERVQGKVNTQTPFLTQFSKTIACVFVGEKPYFLDLTRPQTSMDMVPWQLLNTQGYLVSRKNARFILIQDQENVMARSASIAVEVSAEGMLSGTASIRDMGYQRNNSLDAIRSDKLSYLRKQLEAERGGLEADSFLVDEKTPDSLPLKQDIRFHGVLEPAGNYLTLPLHAFTGLGANPFLAQDRVSDINFGTKQQYTAYIMYRLPGNFALESVPKEITLMMSDTSIILRRSMTVSADQKTITAKLDLAFRKAVYPADNYPALYAFYKKMYTILDEPILLKRTQPQP